MSSSFGMIRGLAMRVTRLDGCGRIAAAECSSVVSDGFVSVELSANTDTQDDITVTNAAGRNCIQEPGAPIMNGYGVTVTFCGVDPALFSMMSGQPISYDADGVAVGFDVDGDVDATESGFALETWSKVPGQACGTGDSQGVFGYLLLPFLQGGVLGDFTIENGAVSFQISNATTKKGNAWGSGPYDVQLGSDGTAGPLVVPMKSSSYLRIIKVEVAPPAPSDCVSNGTEATTATAGTPGTWGPANSYAPGNFAELTDAAPTADPTTAWDAGQYVVLGDDSQAYWDGTDWQTGAAPTP